MITEEGRWIPEGLEEDDPARIRTTDELTDYINEVGFLPMFANGVKGFSMEEHVGRTSWWSGDEAKDPWEWRAVLAREGNVAYGKLFSGKAGFISRDWYADFANYRRDGYDFDSRYEDGKASRKLKQIMDIFEQENELPSYMIKQAAGFGRSGEKGFDSIMNQLQMLTYLTIRDFRKKVNKKGEAYGWSVAVYTRPELLFGSDLVRKNYASTPASSLDRITTHIAALYPDADRSQILSIVK